MLGRPQVSVILIAMISCLFFGCAGGQKSLPTSPSPLSDIADFWDFGQVREGDVLKHEFIFENITERELQIKDVNTSCGCTVSDVKKRLLSVGESTSLDVEFNSKGYSGVVKQHIYVITDDPEEPISKFVVKGTVK